MKNKKWFKVVIYLMLLSMVLSTIAMSLQFVM